jgi:hypothetical protein
MLFLFWYPSNSFMTNMAPTSNENVSSIVEAALCDRLNEEPAERLPYSSFTNRGIPPFAKGGEEGF